VTRVLLATLVASAIGVAHARQQPDQATREALAAATAADHQAMMAQLGIRKLRPGPSGNESAPNHANYDEALANPFPKLPDPLTLKNGRTVTSAAMWRRRRAEIVEDFEREVVGRVPKQVPAVTWTVLQTVNADVAGHPVVGRRLIGHVDNSSYPAITVDIRASERLGERSSGNRAADCRRLGLRAARAVDDSSRQRRRVDERHHRARQQRTAAQT
jgi:hypothetical protein